MKAKDIVNQLKGALPLFTRSFTDQVGISSIVVSGGVATVTTTAAHGLTTGDYAIVRDAVTPNEITSLSRTGSIATAVTSQPHSLTKSVTGNDYVSISGATETEYNGTKLLLSIPSQTSFTYSVSGAPSTPATGAPQLNEFFLLSDEQDGFTHINGVHAVTVTGTTTLQYSVNACPDVTAAGTPFLEVRPRISATASLDRAIDSYTKQSDDALWGFVVLEDRAANRNRQVNTDATDSKSSGADSRQIVIAPFSFYVFFPSSHTLSGRAARDMAEDIAAPLFKSVLGVKFSSGLFADKYGEVCFVEHGAQEYNAAYYIHRYTFETQIDISYEDTAKSTEVHTIWRCVDFDIRKDGAPDPIQSINVIL